MVLATWKPHYKTHSKIIIFIDFFKIILPFLVQVQLLRMTNSSICHDKNVSI